MLAEAGLNKKLNMLKIIIKLFLIQFRNKLILLLQLNL